MATTTACILNGRSIGIDEALDIKDRGSSAALDFRYTECNQPVRPHGSGGHEIRVR